MVLARLAQGRDCGAGDEGCEPASWLALLGIGLRMHRCVHARGCARMHVPFTIEIRA